MQDLFGSVRRSLVFRANLAEDDDDGGTDTNAIGGGGRLAEKISSCIRKSRVGLGLGFGFPPKQLPCPSPPPRPSPSVVAADLQSPPAIRWRKEELIGIGAFGHVYKAVNIDTGGFLAVKQVLIGANSASKEKAQAHVRELEEEVKLLKNLSHPNIVRYLGAAREEETLNILMEYVPGGSISSNLGKDGPFTEDQIRMYTTQLLLGLDYLHKNGIIHRDIKGANILVDNNGCIKLADFGASKQVAKLATMTAAKSMKGTPYWMAPEVILQTGHNFSADIWSVGCTVIEMATGKPPWSQQFQEVAALFHIGTTKSHPPIPEHLSTEAKDFLLKCLQKEPKLRPTSSDLLQHPFVVSQIQQANRSTISRVNSPQNSSLHLRDRSMVASSAVDSGANSLGVESPDKLFNVRPLWETSCSDDDLCHHGDKGGFLNIRSSFNPMSEPVDEWPCKFNVSPNTQSKDCGPVDGGLFNGVANVSEKVDDFSFPCVSPCEDDDDEVTESKIRAFLDEKAIDLKKLQTPLYEFYNTLDESKNSSSAVGNTSEEITSFNSKLPPKSKSSPSKRLSGLLPSRVEPVSNSPSKASRQMPSYCGAGDRALKEIPSPKFNELKELLPESQNEQIYPSFSEKRRKWKEELDEELQRNREMMRQAGVAGRVSSPIDRCTSQRSDRVGFPSPGK